MSQIVQILIHSINKEINDKYTWCLLLVKIKVFINFFYLILYFECIKIVFLEIYVLKYIEKIFLPFQFLRFHLLDSPLVFL